MTADLSVALARRAAAGELDTQVLDWLRAGFEQYARGDCTLEQALRLDRASRIRQRDAALLRAAEALGPASSAWALAGRLEVAVRRFRSRVWPRVRAGIVVDLPPVDEALMDAHATGTRVPATQRSLFDLLV